MRGWGYETFWRGELWVRHFTFDSLEDYLDYLASAPVLPPFDRGCASEAGSAEFTETESLEEALALARFGWHEGLNTLVNMVEAVKRALDLKLEARRTFHDYVGFAPDVKAYLEGSPLSMVNKPNPPREKFTIYMNTSCDGSARRERIYARGAVVLAVAEVLEMMGYLVDLRLFELSFVDKDVHFSEFRLKAPDERVNLAKMHFPLCHPSWVRRLNFRLIETSPNMTDGWAGSYGIPADAALTRAVLGLGEGDVLVPTVDELGVAGEDVLADAQRLFDLVNVRLPADKQLRYR